MSDVKYQDRMEKSIKSKLDLIKSLLKVQLEILDLHDKGQDYGSVENKIDLSHQLMKEIYDQDVLFVTAYEGFLKANSVKTVEEIPRENIAFFKPIQSDISKIQTLMTHVELQNDMIKEIEALLNQRTLARKKIQKFHQNSSK